MKARRHSSRKSGAVPRADGSDENQDLNENGSKSSPLIGLAALRESLPPVDKKSTLPSKPYQPRFRQTPLFAGSKKSHSHHSDKSRSFATPSEPNSTSASSSCSAPCAQGSGKSVPQEGSILSALDAGTRLLESQKLKLKEHINPSSVPAYGNKSGTANKEEADGELYGDEEEDGRGEENEEIEEVEEDRILSEAFKKAVMNISGEGEDKIGENPRPRVIMDIGGPAKDMLFLTNIPKEMTYDRLQHLVSPFGEVMFINWDAASPDVAEVVYADARDAEEAMHYLSDSILGGSEDELPLGAELKSRDGGTQLFIGDLSPAITEEMLEDAFGKLVSGRVTANLKRDPGNNSTIGYGFLTFEDEFAASKALIEGHRMTVGDVKVRVGRAERNTFLYVSDLQPNVTLDELKQVFGQYGSLVEEDTVIVRRSYAFIRYRNRISAEQSKRTLDKTSLRGKMTVRYAEAEPIKSTVQVQFHSSLKKPPSSLKELLHATFSKYGHCYIDIPRVTSNGSWRKTAFVQYHGDPIAAALAATNAVQNVTFVSAIPVLCQFARELIPRVSPKNAASHQGGQGSRTGAKFVGASGSSSRREKSSTRDSSRQPFAESRPSLSSAQTSTTPMYSPYFTPSTGYAESFTWKEGSQGNSMAEEENKGTRDGDYTQNSPGRKQKDASGGKRGAAGSSEAFPSHDQNHTSGSQRRRPSNGNGVVEGMNRGNGEVTYMPVWVPANMGSHFSGQDMPSDFSGPLAPPGFLGQYYGPAVTPNIYAGQLATSPGGQYGIHVPVVPQSSMGMVDMSNGSFHVDGQPGNPHH